MVERVQAVSTATNLVERAIELFEAVNENASAIRLRSALTIICDDTRRPGVARERETALSLMRMALAVLDRAEEGTGMIACRLQAAIDCAREARVLREGDETHPELIEALIAMGEPVPAEAIN